MPIKFICNPRLYLHHGTKYLSKNYSSCPKENIGYPYLILRARKDDYNDILRLMHRAYYREEPTCRALAYQPNNLMENQTIQVLNQGLSFVAKCKYNGTVVGAAMNEITNPWDAEQKERLACMVKCIKTRKLLNFYAYLQKLPDLYDTYNVHQIAELAYLFVRKEDRGRGLGLKLMEISRCLAADCAYPIFRVDATSAHTALICHKLKMKLVCEVPYKAYVDAYGEPIFHPIAPHMSAKVYIDDQLRQFKKK